LRTENAQGEHHGRQEQDGNERRSLLVRQGAWPGVPD